MLLNINSMPVQTDNIGMFIKGMAQPDELIKYIKARFSEQEIEETYARMS